MFIEEFHSKKNVLMHMVLILYGNWKNFRIYEGKNGLFGENNLICNCSWSNQTSYTGQIIDIAPQLRTYF